MKCRISLTLVVLLFMSPLLGAASSPPSAPQDIQGGWTDEDNIMISWEEPASDGGATIDAYYVYRFHNGTQQSTIELEGDKMNYIESAFTDEGVVKEGIYEYYVTAVNDNGESQWSDRVIVTLLSQQCSPIRINLADTPPVDVDPFCVLPPV